MNVSQKGQDIFELFNKTPLHLLLETLVSRVVLLRCAADYQRHRQNGNRK